MERVKRKKDLLENIHVSITVFTRENIVTYKSYVQKINSREKSTVKGCPIKMMASGISGKDTILANQDVDDSDTSLGQLVSDGLTSNFSDYSYEQVEQFTILSIPSSNHI
jgi:hypothetical protein